MIVEHVSTGGAAAFHALELPASRLDASRDSGRDLDRESDGRVPHLWWFWPDRSAVVLGSTQNESVLDLAACRRLGLDVVTRRSGGGVVLVGPDVTVWLDVLVPRGHASWDDDIGRATWWLGETWAETLAELGLDDVHVHRGAMESSELARIVCFAGRGPGEVFVGSTKVVGISQRRTRDWARFQCALSVRWDAETMAEVVASPSIDAAALHGLGSTLDLDRHRLAEDLTGRLTSRLMS